MMRKCKVDHSRIAPIMLLMAGIALTSCTTVLQPIKQSSMTTYAVDVRFEPAVFNENGMTLLVKTPIAHAGFNSFRMVYIKKAHEIDYFSRNQWVDTPARMLTPLLVQALEHTAQYRAVVQGGSAVKADLRLDTEIIHFQHEFLVLPSQVHLSMRAQLADIQKGSVIATRVFDVVETASSDDPYGGVVATNLAVKKLLQQVAEFCAQESKDAKSGIAKAQVK